MPALSSLSSLSHLLKAGPLLLKNLVFPGRCLLKSVFSEHLLSLSIVMCVSSVLRLQRLKLMNTVIERMPKKYMDRVLHLVINTMLFCKLTSL